MFVLKKMGDEGTSSPYIARMYSGIFKLRDTALSHKYNTHKIEKERLEFDRLHKPVLDALETCRTSTKQLENLWTSYVRKVEMGLVVSFQRNAMNVSECIDKQLRDLITSILVNGVIALKGTQKITALFGVDIGCLFMKQENFKKGIELIKLTNGIELADFLSCVRDTWSEIFIYRRNSLEHEGWVLPEVKFITILTDKIGISEPSIDGVNITRYSRDMTNRLISTIENLIVYSLGTAIKAPMVIVEIPEIERDTSIVERFKLDLDRPGVEEWKIKYTETDFI